MQGKLFLCATPIGNLKDITLRTLEVLKSVDLIAAEDTRHSLKLLNHYGIKAKLTSYHEHNKFDKAEELILKMKDGLNVALVTDAGTPGISDPGEELVKACFREGIAVTSLPGASALPVALSMCGLSSRRFVFEGFLPAEKKERKEALERLRGEIRTIVLYEAPHRIVKTLKELSETVGDRNIRICRELTKVHECVMAFTVNEAIVFFESNAPKGEMVIVIDGADADPAKDEARKRWECMSIEEHVGFYIKQGFDEKAAMKLVAGDRNIPKREVYGKIKI